MGTMPVQLIVWGNATDLEPPPVSSGRKGCCSCVQLYRLLPSRALLQCELVRIATQKKKCTLAECGLESIPNAVLKCIVEIVWNFAFQSIDSHRPDLMRFANSHSYTCVRIGWIACVCIGRRGIQVKRCVARSRGLKRSYGFRMWM